MVRNSLDEEMGVGYGFGCVIARPVIARFDPIARKRFSSIILVSEENQPKLPDMLTKWAATPAWLQEKPLLHLHLLRKPQAC
jgi:hypothetical protein